MGRKPYDRVRTSALKKDRDENPCPRHFPATPFDGRLLYYRRDQSNFKSLSARHHNAFQPRTYGEPVFFAPASGVGKAENQGLNAFLPLINSGISAYIWSGRKFFSIVLYTCKGFDGQAAIAYTKSFLQTADEFASRSV